MVQNNFLFYPEMCLLLGGEYPWSWTRPRPALNLGGYVVVMAPGSPAALKAAAGAGEVRLQRELEDPELQAGSFGRRPG